MSLRSLARLLVGYVVLLFLACWLVRHAVAVDGDSAKPRVTVATVWVRGERVARAVLDDERASDPRLAEAAARPGATLVHESVVAEGPILTGPEIAFALSLVPSLDGVVARLGGKTGYVTPDDLFARQGYDKGKSLPGLGLSIGADVPLVLAMLADELKTTAPEVAAHASIRRIRVARTTPDGNGVPGVAAPKGDRLPTAATLTAGDAEHAAVEAARYLARGIQPDGRFRYFVDAPTNRTLAGYDWPRHSGATYFLAQASIASHDASLGFAALRAASVLRDRALGDCGGAKCIGTDNMAEIGSSSLALIAFVEIVRGHLDDSYRPLVSELARFLRRQQRYDGEFMHVFDRETSQPVDVQFLYFSGEATLALSRAHMVTNDPADLDAAVRGLANLVGPAWSFFGDRYYYGEEHWTCQAMDDLWDRSANRDALDFCLRWHAYSRKMQFREGDSLLDVDGAFGLGPLVTPRLTPVGSRSEAAAATLAAARRANVPLAEQEALDGELRHALSLLVRHQLRPTSERAYLFADPEAVRGALPGSPVDWQLRIDYAQHAGSALLRWAELTHP